MSWSEVKKALNTDIDEPLNYYNYINDLIMFGESSYVLDAVNVKIWEDLSMNSILLYKHPEIHDLVEDRLTQENINNIVAKSSKLGAQLNYWFNVDTFVNGGIDKVMANMTLDDNRLLDARFSLAYNAYCESKMSLSSGLGEWMANTFGAEFEHFRAFNNMSDIAESESAWATILTCEPAFLAVASSTTGVNMIAESSVGFERMKDILLSPATHKGACINVIANYDWLVANLIGDEGLLNDMASEESSTLAFITNKSFANALRSDLVVGILGDNGAAVNMLYKLYLRLVSSNENIANLKTYKSGMAEYSKNFSNTLRKTNEYTFNSEVTADKLTATEDTIDDALEWIDYMINTYQVVDDATAVIVNSEVFNDHLCDSTTSMNAITVNNSFWQLANNNTWFMQKVYLHSAGIGKYIAKVAAMDTTEHDDFDAMCKDADAIDIIIDTANSMTHLLKSDVGIADLAHNPIAIHELYTHNTNAGLMRIRNSEHCVAIFDAESDTDAIMGGCMDLACGFEETGLTLSQQVQNADYLDTITSNDEAMWILASRPQAMDTLLAATGGAGLISNSETALNRIKDSDIASVKYVNKLVALYPEDDDAVEYMTAAANSESAMVAVASTRDSMRAAAANEAFWDAICSSPIGSVVIYQSEIGSQTLDENPAAVDKMFGNEGALTGLIALQDIDIFNNLANSVAVTEAMAKSEDAVRVMFGDEDFMRAMIRSNTAMSSFGRSPISVKAICTFLEYIETSQRILGEISDFLPTFSSPLDRFTEPFSTIDSYMDTLSTKTSQVYNGVSVSKVLGDTKQEIADTQQMVNELKAKIVATRTTVNTTTDIVDKLVEVADLADDFVAAVFVNDAFTTQLVSNSDALRMVVNSAKGMRTMADNPSISNKVLRNETARELVIASEVARTQFVNSTVAMNGIFSDSTNFQTVFLNNSAWYSALINSSVAMHAAAISELAMNQIANSSGILTELAGNSVAMGEILASNVAMTKILASSIAMDIIMANDVSRGIMFNSKVAMDAIFASSTAATSMANNSKAMTEIAASSTACTSMAASSTAMTAVAASSTAMTAVAASSTAMTAVAASSTAMTAVNGSATARSKCNASRNALWYIGKSSTARAVSNYTPACSNVAGLATEYISAYIEGICNIAVGTYANMSNLAANATHMATVAASSTAMSAVAASSTAMSACLKNATAVAQLKASSTALNKITTTPVAIQQMAKNYSSFGTYSPLLIAINANITYVRNVRNILANTVYFTAGTSQSQDAVSNANNIGTATYGNMFAVAAGTWSDTSAAWTNVFVNNVQVNSVKLNNTVRPQLVDNSTVSAIAVPTVTFTETGDGHVAVQAYTSK